MTTKLIDRLQSAGKLVAPLDAFWWLELGWRWFRGETESELEADRARQASRYVAPLPTTTIKSPEQRDATRRRMRERVESRRQRDQR